MATKKTEPKAAPALTDYVVLKRVSTATSGSDDGPHAWATIPETSIEPTLFAAVSKQAAIRAHTGDGPEIAEGTFRAIPLSSWRGGVTTKRVMAAERLPLD